jgi:hypothetical protein
MGFSSDVNQMEKQVQQGKHMPLMPRSSKHAEQPATAFPGIRITMCTTYVTVRDAL